MWGRRRNAAKSIILDANGNLREGEETLPLEASPGLALVPSAPSALGATLLAKQYSTPCRTGGWAGSMGIVMRQRRKVYECATYTYYYDTTSMIVLLNALEGYDSTDRKIKLSLRSVRWMPGALESCEENEPERKGEERGESRRRQTERRN